MGKNNKEYICKCHKITKKDMKDAIKNGIESFKDLQKETKIGTKCSGCKKRSKERFKKYRKKLST
jgi:bacterioferritin-associated ferredoxin